MFKTEIQLETNTKLLYLQGLLTSTSQVVSKALKYRIVPAHYIVVIPSHWGEQTCGTKFKPAKGQTRYQVFSFTNVYINAQVLVFDYLSV